MQYQFYRSRNPRTIPVLLILISFLVLITFAFAGRAEAATAADFTIRDDSIGGNCTSIGTWNNATKTCTLSVNINIESNNDGIRIESDNITLDGNGKTITGKGVADTAGVLVFNAPGVSVTGATVKNLTTTNFCHGIKLDNSVAGIVTGVTSTDNTQNGISVTGPNNRITGNTFSTNTIANIYLNFANGNTITGNFIDGGSVSGNGIYLAVSSNNVVAGNTIGLNNIGIYNFPTSSNNIISGNAMTDNGLAVSFALSSDANTFKENTVTTSGAGTVFYIDSSSDNILFHNNFHTASDGGNVVNSSSGNIFSLSAPDGGNYWSKYDTAPEGCVNANGDNFCDAPYAPAGLNFSDGLPWTKASGWSTYYWTWYDNFSSMNWVLMANPAGSLSSIIYRYKVSTFPMTSFMDNPANGTIAPGASAPSRFLNETGQPNAGKGMVGGPVTAVSKTGTKAIASQRSLWKGGNSLEEVLGTNAEKLSSHYYWTWYDNKSPGWLNWVMISNPGDAPIYYRIRIEGADPTPYLIEGKASDSIAAGQSKSARFNLKGGPVEVETFSDSAMTLPANAIASQRVLSNAGTASEAFNEVPGIPVGELSNDYLWTWYDNVSAGAFDWILIANPNATDINYEIRVKGAIPLQMIEGTATGTIPPGTNVTPRIRNVSSGPVEVLTCVGVITDGICGDVEPANNKSIASQRVLWGPSFEEVPGSPKSTLGGDYHWTWYDQYDAGTYDWIHIINTTGSTINYQITVGGVAPSPVVEGAASGTIPAGELVHPRFAKRGGPVEVKSCSVAFVSGTCPDVTPPPIMTSQRVLWHGYFNEVLGTVLD